MNPIVNTATGSTQPAAELSDRSQYRDQLVSEAEKDRGLQRDLQGERIGAQKEMQDKDIAASQQQQQQRQQLEREAMAQQQMQHQQRMEFEGRLFELEDAARKEQQAISMQLQAAQLRGDAKEATKLRELSMRKAQAARMFQAMEQQDMEALLGLEGSFTEARKNLGAMVRKVNEQNQRLSVAVQNFGEEIQERLINLSTADTVGQMSGSMLSKGWEEIKSWFGGSEVWKDRSDETLKKRAEEFGYDSADFLEMVGMTGMFRESLTPALIQFMPNNDPQMAAAAAQGITELVRTLSKTPDKFTPADAQRVPVKVDELSQKYGLTKDAIYTVLERYSTAFDSVKESASQGQVNLGGAKGTLLQRRSREAAAVINNFHMSMPNIHLDRITAVDPAAMDIVLRQIREDIQAGMPTNIDRLKSLYPDNDYLHEQFEQLLPAITSTVSRLGESRKKMDEIGMDLVGLMGQGYDIQAGTSSDMADAVEQVIRKYLRTSVEQELGKRNVRNNQRFGALMQ